MDETSIEVRWQLVSQDNNSDCRHLCQWRRAYHLLQHQLEWLLRIWWWLRSKEWSRQFPNSTRILLRTIISSYIHLWKIRNQFQRQRRCKCYRPQTRIKKVAKMLNSCHLKMDLSLIDRSAAPDARPSRQRRRRARRLRHVRNSSKT